MFFSVFYNPSLAFPSIGSTDFFIEKKGYFRFFNDPVFSESDLFLMLSSAMKTGVSNLKWFDDFYSSLWPSDGQLNSTLLLLCSYFDRKREFYSSVCPWLLFRFSLLIMMGSVNPSFLSKIRESLVSKLFMRLFFFSKTSMVSEVFILFVPFRDRMILVDDLFFCRKFWAYFFEGLFTYIFFSESFYFF